ncbi:MAG: ribonuclease J [Alphaproteobacteria bacterium]|nr:ribonuclease J [Alphaproteobacteria bacterium]
MNRRSKQARRPPDDALWFLPLGGSGEIGMNFNLYGTAGQWLIVDCGVTFGDETTPGIDLITPDISFIIEHREFLAGLVVTHGHEDHIGAISYLWPQLKCPIYATPFTATLIRNKLAYQNLDTAPVCLYEKAPGDRFSIGAFDIEFIPVTHSVPESQMLVLRTACGTVLHTGDWKFDPDPIIGNTTAVQKIKALGAEGVMAVVADSTNAQVEGHSGSEREAQDEFRNLFPTIKQRIVVTCFASNVARIKSIALAAKAAGRYVTLVGRSLWRNAEAAHACGYLPEFDEFLSENEAMLSPRDKIVMITTGCQGEARAALARIANDDHPEIELDAGDTVIFSSRNIPGNERAIARLQNNLIALGLSIITPDDAPVHVSGHAAKDEMTQLYTWTKPALLLPVHGEARHQSEHAALAKRAAVKDVMIPQNGQIIRLGPGIHEVVAEVPAGRWGLDGTVLRSLDADVAKNRKKLSLNGLAAVTIVMNAKGQAVRDPQISLMGLVDESALNALQDKVSDALLDAIEAMPKSARSDDAALRHAVAMAVRRTIKEQIGKKPVTDVHVVRI